MSICRPGELRKQSVPPVAEECMIKLYISCPKSPVIRKLCCLHDELFIILTVYLKMKKGRMPTTWRPGTIKSINSFHLGRYLTQPAARLGTGAGILGQHSGNVTDISSS